MFDKEKIEAIRRARERWEQETLQCSLEVLPETKETFTTISGLEVKRLYTPRTSNTSITNGTWGFRVSTPLPEGYTPPCTGPGYGR